jgi:hypothetical protein
MVCVAVTPVKLKDACGSFQNLLEGSVSIQIKYVNSIGCAN